MQNEITEQGKLLDEKGALRVRGYAKSLILDYDRNDIKAKKFRIKEWDYYLITSEKYGIALTISDNSYMCLTSATFLDFTKGWEHTQSEMSFFSNGKTNLPKTSKIGDVKGLPKGMNIEFLNDGKQRVLKLDYPKFDNKKGLSCNIVLTEEPKDSMVIATPFKEKETHFYYNQKIIGMKAEGSFCYDGAFYQLENAKGMLDWGRGVWPYSNTWYWGAGQGEVEGVPFGFNIGYGFGDTTAASENMLFYNGVAHKLDRLTFNIPMKDGKEDYTSPWTFTSSDKRFETEFIPIIDRSALTSIGIILSDQHQVFGKMNGKVTLDDGKEIILKDFLCFAEKVRNKW